MARTCSTAVEILPSPTMDWVIGSIKTCTARVAKNGRNIATKKVKQPNKTGADPRMFTGARDKWRAMTKEEKLPWQEIAAKEDFRSGWNAFLSSFFRSVAIHGLEYTMSHELIYIYSDHRQKKAEQLSNSLKRLSKYEVQDSFYLETEATLKLYPVEFSSEHIYVRLRDLNDINNALCMELLYRYDTFTEYEFEPMAEDQYTETGSYTIRKRPRQGRELYQLIS